MHIILSKQELLQALEQAKQGDRTLIYFGASWCGPCKKVKPLLEKIQSESLRIVSVDVGEVTDLSEHFKIQTVPYFILYNGSTMVAQSCTPRTLEDLEAFVGPQKSFSMGASVGSDALSDVESPVSFE